MQYSERRDGGNLDVIQRALLPTVHTYNTIQYITSNLQL